MVYMQNIIWQKICPFATPSKEYKAKSLEFFLRHVISLKQNGQRFVLKRLAEKLLILGKKRSFRGGIFLF